MHVCERVFIYVFMMCMFPQRACLVYNDSAYDASPVVVTPDTEGCSVLLVAEAHDPPATPATGELIDAENKLWFKGTISQKKLYII